MTSLSSLTIGIFAVGFLAQAIFAIRILIQWWESESERMSILSIRFWWCSIVASILYSGYGLLRHDLIIVIGQLIVLPVYLRNVQRMYRWQPNKKWITVLICVGPSILIIYVSAIASSLSLEIQTTERWLFTTGLIGQLMMTIRFFYQIYKFEQKNDSSLPEGFWIMSISGSLLLLVYAIGKYDPVLFFAQIVALIPYGRNLLLVKNGNESKAVRG